MFIWNCDSLTCSISLLGSFCATVSRFNAASVTRSCLSFRRDSQRDVLMDEKGTRLTSTAYGVIQAQPVGILVRPILCYSLPRALDYLRQVAVMTDSDMLGRLRTRLALPPLRAVMTISSAQSPKARTMHYTCSLLPYNTPRIIYHCHRWLHWNSRQFSLTTG